MKDQLEQLYGEYMQLLEQSSDYLIKKRYADKMKSIEILLAPMPYGAPNPSTETPTAKEQWREKFRALLEGLEVQEIDKIMSHEKVEDFRLQGENYLKDVKELEATIFKLYEDLKQAGQ